MRLVTVTSLSLFSLLAVACASSGTSVPVKGPESDLATLAGEWKGHYENDGAGRSGEITFKLEVGRHSAEGQVVMQLPTGEARPLKIQFVEIANRELKGKIDPYRGVPVPADSDIVKYLQGALAVKDKPVSERLKFFFNYLDNPDTEIANDAYKEFGNADYKDFRDMAKELPADKVARWLQDSNTPAFRYGLYASMLGHCGTTKHAEVLRAMLEDPQKRVSSGVDGILAGYTMLKPKEGWEYIRSILKDPSKEFMLRYAALRAVRFFWESRPDVVTKNDMVEAVCLLLDQGDIADLAIEDLRKWGRWEVADRVLGLYGKKSHDVPIIRRSILRFALSCPQLPRAATFVQQLRNQDAEMVKDVEELLKLETATPAPPAPAPKTGS